MNGDDKKKTFNTDYIDWDRLNKEKFGTNKDQVDWQSLNEEGERKFQERQNKKDTSVPLVFHVKNVSHRGLLEGITSMIAQNFYNIVDAVRPGNAMSGFFFDREVFRMTRPLIDVLESPTLGLPSGPVNNPLNYFKPLSKFWDENIEKLEILQKLTENKVLGEEKARELEQFRTGLKKGILQAKNLFDEFLKLQFPSDPDLEDSFWFTDVPQGMGSMASFMVAAAIGRGMGLSQGASALIGGALQSQNELITEAYQITDSLEVAEKAGEYGKWIGMSEAIPIANMFNRISKLTKGVGASKIMNSYLKKYLEALTKNQTVRKSGILLEQSFIQGLEEMTQEAAQQLAQNYTAQQLYDFNRELTEGMAHGGAVGFVTGALTNLIMMGVNFKNIKSPAEIEAARKLYQDVTNAFAKVASGPEVTQENVSSAVATLLTMGNEGAIPFDFKDKDNKVNPEYEAKARAEVQKGFGQRLEKVLETLKEIENPTIIDAIIHLGRENLSIYEETLNKSDDKVRYENIIEQSGILSSITRKDLHELAEDIRANLLGKALKAGIAKNYSEDVDGLQIDPIVKKELQGDLVLLTALGMGPAGKYLMEAKYKEIAQTEGFQNLLNKVQQVREDNLSLAGITQSILPRLSFKLQRKIETNKQLEAAKELGELMMKIKTENARTEVLAGQEDALHEPDFEMPAESDLKQMLKDAGVDAQWKGIQKNKTKPERSLLTLDVMVEPGSKKLSGERSSVSIPLKGISTEVIRKAVIEKQMSFGYIDKETEMSKELRPQKELKAELAKMKETLARWKEQRKDEYDPEAFKALEQQIKDWESVIDKSEDLQRVKLTEEEISQATTKVIKQFKDLVKGEDLDQSAPSPHSTVKLMKALRENNLTMVVESLNKTLAEEYSISDDPLAQGKRIELLANLLYKALRDSGKDIINESLFEPEFPSFNLEGSNIIPFNNPKTFEVVSIFDKWIDKQSGRIDLSQPFKVKDLTPFGQRVVERFRQEYLAKNNFTSVPKDRIQDFKRDWKEWLKENFGLRHREGTYGDPFEDGWQSVLYGLDNILKERDTRVEDANNIRGSEVIISGNFLLKDMPHEYSIGATIEEWEESQRTGIPLPEDQQGAGLGWYIYSEVNGEPFIYEWQSDILPDLFGKSVSSTVKEKDAEGNVTSETETLTSGEVRISDINGTKYYSSNPNPYYTTFTYEGNQYWKGTEEIAFKASKNEVSKADFLSTGPGPTEISIEELNKAWKLAKNIKEITKQEFEAKKEELSKQSAEQGLKSFLDEEEASNEFILNNFHYNRQEGYLNSDAITFWKVNLDTGEYIEIGYKEFDKAKSDAKELMREDKGSPLATLENLYKKFWNIWLMHSFIYAKERGHSTVWLPTGEAMLEIEGSQKTAAMYATKFDLQKGSNTFDKVGAYWTALNKIKGIKLELAQPEWSTVPLIKADISQVDTSAYQLFESEFEDVPQGQTEMSKPQAAPGTYGAKLANFKGTTIRELFNYLKENHLNDPVFAKLEEYVSRLTGDVPVKVMNIQVNGKSKRGLYTKDEKGKPYIAINPNVTLTKPNFLYITALHESLHVLLDDFILKNDPRSKLFVSKIESILDYVANARDQRFNRTGLSRIPDHIFRYMNAPQNKAKFDYYLKGMRDGSEENRSLAVREFLSGVLSGDPDLIYALSQIQFTDHKTGQTRSTLAQFIHDFIEWIKSLFKDIKVPSGNVITAVQRTLEDHYEDILAFHYERQKAEGVISTKKVYRTIMEEVILPTGEEDVSTGNIEDMLDNGQESEEEGYSEIMEEIKMVTGFTTFIAELMDKELSELYADLKTMTPGDAKRSIDKLDKELNGYVNERLTALFNKGYKKYGITYDTFKDAMITRLVNRAQELSSKDIYVLEIIRGFRPKYNIVKQGFHYVDAKGKAATALRENIALESFIEPLTAALGLPQGSIKIAFIESFNTYAPDGNGRGNLLQRATLDKLGAWNLGLKGKDDFNASVNLSTILSNLKDPINDKKFLFLGNFADKNTLPVLSIDANPEVQAQFEKIIATFEQKYKAILIEKFGDTYNLGTPKTNSGAIVRMLLEDLWYGIDITQPNFESRAVQLDWNKAQKRGTKWVYNQTFIQEDVEHLSEFFMPKTLYGRIALQDLKSNETPSVFGKAIYRDNKTNKVWLRQAVFNTKSTEEYPVEIDGKTYDLNLLIRNALATSRMDGASFYILGEFDAIYHKAYGTIKRGALKNVIGINYGDPSLFVKHAMHSLHPDDPLAKWMKKNDIAVLTADESAKIPTMPNEADSKFSLAELSQKLENREDERINHLPLSYFARYKEEQNVSFMGGKWRQVWNGTAYGTYHPSIKASDPSGMFDDNILNLSETVIKRAMESLAQKDIQYAFDELFNIIKIPNSPKQLLIAKMLKDFTPKDKEALIEEYVGIIHHTLVSSQINNKLRDELLDAIQMVVPGARVALGPSLGILAKRSQVDTVTNINNIKLHLTSLPVDHEAFKAAVPEKKIREYLKIIRKLQSEISLLKSKGRNEEADDKEFELDGYKLLLSDEAESHIRDLEKLDSEKAQWRIRHLRYGVISEGKRQSLHNLIDVTDSEVSKWSDKLLKDILEEGSSTLQHGYVLITQDIASRYGIKPGDKVLAVVTPTDSPMSVTAVTVAAVLPSFGSNAVSEYSKAIFNSEYIQTIVGKDFDIDTISIIPYDTDYWTPEQFDNVANVFRNVNDNFKRDMASYLQGYFDNNRRALQALPNSRDEEGALIKANQETIFGDQVRVAYAQLKLGISERGSKDTFAPIGEDYHYINSAYMGKDPSKIISIRLTHTLLSAIDAKANGVELPVFGKGSLATGLQKVSFNVNHDDWMGTHILHLILTHHLLDFPNNTSMLEYNSNLDSDEVKIKMFKYMWGIHEDTEIGIEHVETINEVINLLFGTALRVVKGMNEHYKTASYFDIIKDIDDQKFILEILKAGDMSVVADMYDQYLDQVLIDKRDNPDVALLNEKKKQIGRAFIKNLDIADNLFKYPLFTAINNVDIEQLPFYGMTQKESLRTESLVGMAIAGQNPRVVDILKKEIFPHIGKGGKKSSFFVDSETGELYSSYAMKDGYINPDVDAIALSLLAEEQDYQRKRSDKPLDSLRRVAVSIITGAGEVDAKEVSDELKSNRDARAKAFPILVEKLLHKPHVTLASGVRGISLLSSSDGKKSINLTVDSFNRLMITAAGVTYSANYILNANTPEANRLRVLLTTKDGVWTSWTNRLALTNFINFSDNIKLEERNELLRDWISQNLYENRDSRLDREDLEVFWMSFFGQLTNAGLKDNRAVGLTINRAEMNPEMPYTYTYNDILLDQLSYFEPSIMKDYLFYFNHFARLFPPAKVKNVIEAMRNDVRGYESDILFEPEFEETPGRYGFVDFMLETMKDLDRSFFRSVEYRKFKKILNSENGYAKGLDYLKKLFSEINILSTLHENNYDLHEVIGDIHNLTTAQFKKKYSNLNTIPIDKAFGNHEAAAQFLLEEFTELDSSKAKLKQLMWMYYKIRKSQISEPEMRSWLRANASNDALYAYKRERKTYSLINPQDTIGFSMAHDSKMPKPLSPYSVGIRFKVLPTTVNVPVGEASLAIKKAEDLKRAINRKADDMKLNLRAIEEVIELFQSKKKRASKIGDQYVRPFFKAMLNRMETEQTLSEAQIRAMIFDLAENMYDNLGVRLIKADKLQEDITKEPYYYTAKVAGQTLTFSSPYELIERVFPHRSSTFQLALLGALEYRKMYDFTARDMIETALNYLKATRDELASDLTEANEGLVYVIRAIRTYESYLEAIDKGRFNYMPHAYPMHEYEALWKDQNYNIIKNGLIAQRKAHQKMIKNGIPNADLTIANMTDTEIATITEERLEEGWRQLALSQTGTSFIPNFQRRLIADPEIGYNKITPKPHTEYIFRTMNGVKTDLMLADWFAFENKARRKGESNSVISSMKHWYSDQITQRVLNSKKIRIDKIKKGMRVSFLVQGGLINDENEGIRSEIRVSGIVNKITKDRIFLFVDPANVVKEAERRLKIYENKFIGIEQQHGDATITDGQYNYIMELIDQGYMSKIDPTNWTVKEANINIFNALQDAIKNPDKLGSYQRNMIYTRDYNGKKNLTHLDRYSRRGALELLEGKAKELRNIRAMTGNLNIIEEGEYRLLKGVELTINFMSELWRRTVGQLIMGLLAAPKAFTRNSIGILVGNFIHSPITFTKAAIRGFSKYGKIKNTPSNLLTDEELALASVLSSMNLLHADSVINITMNSLNLNREDAILATSLGQKIKKGFKLFNEASGYSSYIEELSKLAKIKRQLLSEFSDAKAEGNDKLTREILAKMKANSREMFKHKAAWRFKMEGIVMDPQATDREWKKKYDELLAKPVSEQNINEAAQLGVTRKDIVKAFGKDLINGVYEGWLGLKLQSIPEWLRIPILLGAFESAKMYTGGNFREALQYASNYVEAFNAFYNAEDKQRGANTKLGRSLFQFTQFVYNNISKQMEMLRQAVDQQIGKDVSGPWERIKSLLQRDYTSITELSKSLQDQAYISKKDMNLARVLAIRWSINMTVINAGMAGMIPGIQWVMDPFMNFIYAFGNLIADLVDFSTGDDDEEDLKNAILDAGYDVIFWWGPPVKTAMTMATLGEDQPITDAFLVGRIGSQIGTMDRLINDYRSFIGDEDLTRKEARKTFFDPKFLINNFIFGINLFGDTFTEDERYEWAGTSNILGERVIEFPKYKGIKDPDKDQLSVTDRIRLTITNPHRSLLPWGHRIWRND